MVRRRGSGLHCTDRGMGIKLNVDAVFQHSSGASSSGAVIRDHTGLVLLSVWKVKQRCTTAEDAEPEVCFEGIQLAVECIIESDSRNIVEGMQASMKNRSRYSNICLNRNLHRLTPLCRSTKLEGLLWKNECMSKRKPLQGK